VALLLALKSEMSCQHTSRRHLQYTGMHYSPTRTILLPWQCTMTDTSHLLV